MDEHDFSKMMSGEGEVTILSPDGVTPLVVSSDVLLSNEFEVVVVKPGEIAPEQKTAAFLLTLKGVDARTKRPKAVTVIFEPTMAMHLFKALRLKFVEIPVHHR